MTPPWLGGLAATCVLTITAASLGHFVGRGLWRGTGACRELASDLAAGLICLVLVALALSSVGLYTRPTLHILAALSVLLWRPRQLAALARRSAHELAGSGWQALVLLGVACLGSLAPVVSQDAHVYHYTLPRLYLETGHVYWTQTGVYDGTFHFPHLLTGWFLATGGEYAANLLGSLLFLVLVLAVAAVTAQFLPGAQGLAVLLTYGSPLFFLQSFGGSWDGPPAGFSALALDSWLRALREDRGKDWWLTGLWAGACAGCRINCATVPLALLLLSILQRRGRGIWRASLPIVVLGCVFVVPSLWFNYKSTGNPVYPMGTRWSVDSLRAPGEARVAPVSLATPSVLAANRQWQFVVCPLVGAGLLLALCWRDPRRASLLVPPFVFCLLLLPLQLRDSRYAAAGIAWMLPAAAVGWGSVLERGGAGARVIWGLGLIAGCLPGLLSLIPRATVALGLASGHGYQTQRVEVLPAYEWLATTGYKRVLLVDPRSYLCPKPFFVLKEADFSRQSGGFPEYSLRGLLHSLQSTQCDLVLWNLRLPDVAASLPAPPYGAATLSQQQLARELEPWSPRFAKRCKALYYLTQRGNVVYNKDGVVAVEWPK